MRLDGDGISVQSLLKESVRSVLGASTLVTC